MIPAARPLIGDEERAAVDRVMRSGMLAQGPEVAAFEQEFSALVDGRHCIAVNSGTSALHMSMLAVGIGAGDEVIVPSFSFAATANAVQLAGATAVFADIETDYFSLDPAAVEAAITPRTKAIMPVHLYGHPADLVALEEIAKRHGLLLIEDAAQAHAAAVNGKPVGTWSDAASFSFYPTKNMTSGEGGMVTTASDEVARQMRLLRNQGMEKRYANEIFGFNTRMTDIHAAIGRVQLTKLAGWTAKRQANAAFLSESIEGAITPPIAPWATHVFHQYTIRVVDHDRDRFAEELAARGVGSGVYYPTPIHRLPSFGLDLELPGTELAASQVLSLPIYPTLSDAELETIASAVNEVAKAGS
ncbi:dTDP-4-amino-4,6-dideoxygalactose transaminase [Cryobacterium mesophilum]|uniref:DegT/DnrJ/EryC1/StrS family aminotransferase n=1 Tax=Terrimesophilobacter mesophilus TaxID=433647 RepID=A0A4R8VBP5_9MICO|nr:DegT/DnrJ/EryC1/StrS family aminotransferase [Terrimesophilobacter mesophilus]MBB5632651.1 dTDP-4-amino-4,6-dideoxygalactose transaminase [Terrimesophilobacter mesophilus]TFB79462.1 DegT/DnrJ/EryC1/StrS family aminotransferase [Terrimesophilobacter mesophilus]